VPEAFDCVRGGDVTWREVAVRDADVTVRPPPDFDSNSRCIVCRPVVAALGPLLGHCAFVAGAVVVVVVDRHLLLGLVAVVAVVVAAAAVEAVVVVEQHRLLDLKQVVVDLIAAVVNLHVTDEAEAAVAVFDSNGPVLARIDPAVVAVSVAEVGA
jgi:hypothetical protein